MHAPNPGKVWWCLATYAALALVATYPLILHPFSAIPGSGDAYQFYWNLWWVKRALIELHANPYATDELFAPYGGHLYFHTLNLLQDLSALPVTIVLGLPAAYNATAWLSFVLSGYGAYRLGLYVLEHELDAVASNRRAAHLAAFVAGAAFAFSSYRFVHLLGHLDLVSTQWLPFFVLFLLKTSRETGWRNPVACGALLFATLLTSMYYAVFLLLFLALFVIFVIASRRFDHWRGPMGRIAMAVAVFAIVASPLLVTILSVGRIEGRSSNPAYDVDRFSADLLAFVLPSPLHPLWGRWVTPIYRAIDRHSSGLEAVTFLGFVPLALSIAAVRLRVRRCSTFWIVAAAMFGLLALGPVLYIGGYAVPPLSLLMPYRWFSHFPYGDIPRVPSRFVVMMILCLSVGTAAGASSWLRRVSAGRAVTLTGALVAAIVFENAIWPTPLADLQVPPLFLRLAAEPRAALLEVPIPDDPAVFPRRMLWQTVHGQPVFGGYLSRSLPPLAFDAVPGFAQFKSLTPAIDDVVRYDERQLPSLSRALLNVYGAGHVVIERQLMPLSDRERARTIAESLLGASALRYEDDLTLDYAVLRDREVVAPAVWLDTGWSYLERLAEHAPSGRTIRWRWMSDRARLGLITPDASLVHLQLTLQAFGRPRRLRVAVGGVEIATLLVTRDREVYGTASFSVPAGPTFIELTSLDGAGSPGADPRRLSIAMFDAELVAVR
jgi:hypothetical protein